MSDKASSSSPTGMGGMGSTGAVPLEGKGTEASSAEAAAADVACTAWSSTRGGLDGAGGATEGGGGFAASLWSSPGAGLPCMAWSKALRMASSSHASRSITAGASEGSAMASPTDGD
eukprot:CAMPEP_0118965290 /NCGR_PEP_ID=MMETSP1173-20130426/2872_1 /TAXON_ID=1034831 /ORGANISM="Rhizochromulina marina cf, Strain CCMP1243" /LENGTH=116 /DNA_ID=CAMNT_0006913889 /DNA_START=218 /DNA_END=565 /DNA_ORIENTATION=+